MEKKLVLLVDDERDFVDTLAERLDIRGINARVAYDGETALDMVQSETYRAMVLDLRMPGIDGIEVLRKTSRLLPDLPVIILTGHGNEKDREKCFGLGAFAYMNKPVDIKELAEIIKKSGD